MQVTMQILHKTLVNLNVEVDLVGIEVAVYNQHLVIHQILLLDLILFQHVIYEHQLHELDLNLMVIIINGEEMIHDILLHLLIFIDLVI